MKLVRCQACLDIVKLSPELYEERTCRCGKSGGYYTGQRNAVYWGPAVMLGIDNTSIKEAIENQPESGLGEYFTAFVIPKKCPYVRKIRRPKSGSK